LPARLRIPECPKGIGTLINATDAPALIDGVLLEPVALWPDDRGYFLEVARLGSGAARAYGHGPTQISSALGYPGTIKAFHFHQHQTDLWVPVAGLLQVALVDLRTESPTFGSRNTLYIGALRPFQVLIPPGVAHGYKVVGQQPAILVYITNQFYDPADEGRIAFDDPSIQYDWELQHK
jgi:dTDP-4-dehydrorhamnose 3,5-epimerase